MSIWSQLGDTLIDKGLPLLGGAIAGPAGASLGGLLASALGSDSSDPEQMLKQLQAAPPQMIAKLKELQYRHKERLEELALQRYTAELSAHTQRIESVNKTMREESKAGGLAGAWRPIWGIASAAAFFLMVAAIIFKMFTDATELTPILTGLAGMQWFWGIPLAILGVASWHRGQEKRVMAGEVKNTLTDLAKAVRSKAS